MGKLKANTPCTHCTWIYTRAFLCLRFLPWGWSPGLVPRWGMRSESYGFQSPSPLPTSEAKHPSILSDSSYFVPHSPDHKGCPPFSLYARHGGRIALSRGKTVLVTLVLQVFLVALKESHGFLMQKGISSPIPVPGQRKDQNPGIHTHYKTLATDPVSYLYPTGCHTLYLSSVSVETLSGALAVQKAISVILERDVLPTPTVVHFKVTEQGITLTDVQRK